MGEWKRIYCDGRRLFTLSLIVLLSVVFFIFGKMTYFGPGSAEILVKSERYYASLVKRARTMDEDGIRAMLEDEERRLDDYYWWRSFGYEDHQSVPFAKFKNEVSEHKFLSSLSTMDDENAVRALMAALARVDELKEQLDYISGYAGYLDRIQKQAKLQSMTTVFGSTGGFSLRNIEMTAAEFDSLRGVEVQFGANRAYEGWIEYELADYFYLFLIVLFVFAFTEERRVGLSGVIRSCRYGRGRLGLHRVLILASASVLGVVLIYGVNLLVSVLLSGDFTDMGRAVQSLVCFRTLIQRTTIGIWIIEYMIAKVATGFTIGLFLWCILGMITNVQYSIAVLGAVITVEYMLFAFLPVQSIFNMIKYFNLFAYIRTSKLYTDYLNINMFGYPFGIRNLALFPLPVFTVILFAAVMITAWKRRPEGHRDALSMIAGVWDRVMDKWRRRLTAGGWEVYKTLVFERCAFILAVVIIAGGSLDFIRPVKTSDDGWYRSYLHSMSGPATKEIYTHIEEARAEAKYSGGDERVAALDRLKVHVDEIFERAEAGGYEPWIASDIAYRSILGPDAVDAQRVNAAVAMVFVIALCAAMMPYEQKSGVVYMLRAQKKGRGGVFLRKSMIAAVMTAVAFGSVYVREFITIKNNFDTVYMTMLIRNLDCFSNSPFDIPVWQYLLVLYVLRYVMLLSFACVVIYISSYLKTVESSYIVLMVLLGIPALLYSLGITALGHVSPVRAVSSAEFVWTVIADGGVWVLAPLVIWLMIGITAIILCRHKWCRSKEIKLQIIKTAKEKAA